jgi:hypothetical protein
MVLTFWIPQNAGKLEFLRYYHRFQKRLGSKQLAIYLTGWFVGWLVGWLFVHMYSIKRKYRATKGVPAHRWRNFACLPRRGQLKNWSVGRKIPMKYVGNRINCVTHIHNYAQAVSCPCLAASISGTPRDHSRFNYVAQATKCIYRYLRNVGPTDSYSEHYRLHFGSVTEPHRRIFRVLRRSPMWELP